MQTQNDTQLMFLIHYGTLYKIGTQSAIVLKYFISIHMDPSCMLQSVLTLVGVQYLPRVHNCNHAHFVPPFNLFYNIKFPIGMQLVLGIRELLCDHCTLFFFLSLMLRQPCTRRGGGNIFPPGEKKIPTWGLSFYKKELSCDQIQNHACIAPIYFFVVMWLVYRVCTNNFIPMGANSYG